MGSRTSLPVDYYVEIWHKINKHEDTALSVKRTSTGTYKNFAEHLQLLLSPHQFTAIFPHTKRSKQFRNRQRMEFPWGLHQSSCCPHGLKVWVKKVGQAKFNVFLIVRPSGRGTVHSRPHKIFLHFLDLWTLLNKIREGVALSPLSILHKPINM